MKRDLGCDACRDRLFALAVAETPPAAVREHLARCPACRAVAARREVLQVGIAGHHAGVEPDAGFAGRVVARLARPAPVDLLGGAALRLLPAAAGLAAAVAWWSLSLPPGPLSLLSPAASDAYVTGYLVSGEVVP